MKRRWIWAIFISFTVAILAGVGWQNGRSLEISSPTSTDRDLFGQLFEIDQNLMIVGAGRDSERARGGGAIHVFEKNNNRWQETFKLFPVVSTPFQHFGLSIAYADDILVSTGCTDRGIFEAGIVFVFQRQQGQWREIQQIKTTTCVNRNSMLALENSQLAVGNISSREVVVYEWGGDQFVEQTTLSPRETSIYSITDNYARLKMVAFDDDRIVMSMEDGAGVFVFRNRDGAWIEEQQLTVIEPSLRYGGSIDIFDHRIIVGDPEGWACQGADCVIGGTAYLFEWNGAQWQETMKFQAERPFADSWFGNSVNISEGTIVIGAPLEVAGSFGAAYQFNFCDGKWQQQTRLFAGLNPRTEFAISRGWNTLSENVRAGELAMGEVVTAVQGGYQFPLQIGIGPALQIQEKQIYVGPTRGNINDERIIYEFDREGC
ncbi:MAG: hypothetical protein AAF490_15190 [Chloroflexota bacterium]